MLFNANSLLYKIKSTYPNSLSKLMFGRLFELLSSTGNKQKKEQESKAPISSCHKPKQKTHLNISSCNETLLKEHIYTWLRNTMPALLEPKTRRPVSTPLMIFSEFR